MSVITINGVSKSFGDVAAVRNAHLEVASGEIVALLGPSGCGKTTLLRLLAGFEEPDEGQISLNGQTVASAATSVAPEERHVGMVFQDYALFPHLTMSENVGYGIPRSERELRVPAVLAVVGLCGLGERYPNELSGGQQQRVALARALAPGPKVILLDEPWSNIDPLLRTSMRDELARVLRSIGVTVVLVTHDREEAFSLADRIALMHDGEIVQSGVPEDLYHTPSTRWAAAFVGPANFVPGYVANGHVETPLGKFPLRAPHERARVDVLIRPETLALEPDPGGSAQVVRREFRGHDVFYGLELDDGTALVSQRPSTESARLGDRVRLCAHDAPVTVFSST
jgi:iron(III) transport system ATP-binding protein